VSAREKATGLQKHITIENALARFEQEELDAARDRLEQLWEVPAEADDVDDVDGVGEGEPALPDLVPGPREGQRETVQARALLEKAERLLDKVAPEDRAEV